MGGFTNAQGARLLDHTTGRNPYPAPVATYVILYSEPPTDEGGGTTIEADPQRIHWSAPVVNPTSISNSNTIVWNSSSEWGQVQAFGIVDSQTGASNLLFWGDFEAPFEEVGVGDSFTLTPGDITFAVD